MKRLLALSATTMLAVGLSACSMADIPLLPTSGATTGVGAATAPGSTAGATPATPESSPGPGGPSPATTSGIGPTPGSTAKRAVDQSTPEAAMTSWLTAMLEGDGATVCGLMAAGKTALADLPEAQRQCAGMLAPMLKEVVSVKDMFTGLSITGASVSGDTATFDKAKTKPALAGTIIANLKTIRLDGKWYVTED